MSSNPLGTIGIVGGTGWLGQLVSQAVLRSKMVPPERVWICNRSGSKAGLDKWLGVKFTTEVHEIERYCDTIILAVQSTHFAEMSINAEGKLLISMMAGVSMDKLEAATQAVAIIRALPNAMIAQNMSFTPWMASTHVSAEARNAVQALFESFGEAEYIEDEKQLDYFVSLTGSSEGFVAYYAQAMIDAARKHGINAELAERAVKKLFQGAGQSLVSNPQSPSETVKQFIDLGNSTAQGLKAMKKTKLAADIAKGVEAAYRAATH